jgi:hypothetical protein
MVGFTYPTDFPDSYRLHFFASSSSFGKPLEMMDKLFVCVLGTFTDVGCVEWERAGIRPGTNMYVRQKHPV